MSIGVQEAEDLKKRKPSRGLGRGLSALFAEAVPVDANDPRVLVVPVTTLVPGRCQPRRVFNVESLHALAESIRMQGILQPLLVRSSLDHPNHYELIAGERRWRAAQLANLTDVPVLVRSLGDSDALQIGLIENIQRENLSPIEEAEAYHRLIEEFQHTQEELAISVGRSRSYIANSLRLLTLPDPVKEFVNNGSLSAGHARTLVTFPDAENLAHEIMAKNLSVRETERRVQHGKMKPQPAAHNKQQIISAFSDSKHVEMSGESCSLRIKSIAEDLSAILNARVEVVPKSNSRQNGEGRLTVYYHSLTDLNNIIKRLS